MLGNLAWRDVVNNFVNSLVHLTPRSLGVSAPVLPSLNSNFGSLFVSLGWQRKGGVSFGNHRVPRLSGFPRHPGWSERPEDCLGISECI